MPALVRVLYCVGKYLAWSQQFLEEERVTDTCTSQESGSGMALYSSFVRPTAAAAATSQSICALPMPTCQDIHFFNRLIVTPLLPPRRYSSLARPRRPRLGFSGHSLEDQFTAVTIQVAHPPSLPVSPNELGRGFVPTSFVKIGRRHSPSPTTAALDGKYHAWRIFSTEGFS